MAPEKKVLGAAVRCRSVTHNRGIFGPWYNARCADAGEVGAAASAAPALAAAPVVLGELPGNRIGQGRTGQDRTR